MQDGQVWLAEESTAYTVHVRGPSGSKAADRGQTMAKTILVLGGLLALVGVALAGDMLRKSIVFDKKTPDVFYCPQHKPTGFDKMIVRARPLSKLCELDGQPLPPHYKSDCYNDVDESEYACKEKRRIMKRLVRKAEAKGDSSRDISAEDY